MLSVVADGFVDHEAKSKTKVSNETDESVVASEADGSEATDSSDEVEVPETDDESEDESPKPHKSSVRHNRIADSSEESSDEEEATRRRTIYKQESEEEAIEEQAYSKATRRSILPTLPRKSVGSIEIESSDDDSDDDIIAEVSDLEDASEKDSKSAIPLLSSTMIRSPFKDVSNESFDKSIKTEMSSTVSPKEQSRLVNEVIEEKIKVSPSQYAEAIAAIGVLENQKSSMQKLINSCQLPDGGAKLKIKMKALLAEIADKQNVIEMMEIDENKSVKQEILESFNSDQASNHAISINDSVEVQKAFDLKDVVPAGNIGVVKFAAQKALTIEKLEEICGNIADRPEPDCLVEAPKHLKVTLMKHQLHGVKFMMWRETKKPRGGILADDMGLGKFLLSSLSLNFNE